MSETTQPLPVVCAHDFLKVIVTCPGLPEHFQKNALGPEDLKVMQDLLEDESIVFFSIKRVIARQVYKTKKAQKFIPDENQTQVLEAINAALLKLPTLKCDICGLNGHTNSSCWLNGQIYNTCRSSGTEAQEANFLWREAMKLRRIAREEGLRQSCAERRQRTQAANRLAMKSFRISKASKKLRDRSARIASLLANGIQEERKAASEAME